MIGTAFKKVLSESERCPLLLENTAGAGFTVGRTIEELGAVIDGAGGGSRLGVCLDSCHLLASGHEVRDPKVLSGVVDECKRTFGLELPALRELAAVRRGKQHVVRADLEPLFAAYLDEIRALVAVVDEL